MNSFKSSTPAGFSDVVALLNFLSSPDKVKSAVKELDERIAEAEKLEKETAAKASYLAQAEISISERVKFVEEKEKSLTDMAASLAAKVSAANTRDAQFQSEKKLFEEMVAAFETKSLDEENALSQLQLKAETKMKEANELYEVASAAKKEFEGKLEKLKAL